MDNCLAPSSDGGGYGCDNMTVIIVALLQGKTKEEWYDMVADRVKNKWSRKVGIGKMRVGTLLGHVIGKRDTYSINPYKNLKRIRNIIPSFDPSGK
jgi:hypothetical protein